MELHYRSRRPGQLAPGCPAAAGCERRSSGFSHTISALRVLADCFGPRGEWHLADSLRNDSKSNRLGKEIHRDLPQVAPSSLELVRYKSAYY